MCLSILVNIPVVLCATPTSVIYVAGDGSDDFNCNATNDQIQINQALQCVADNPKYTTVCLKGSFTYIITNVHVHRPPAVTLNKTPEEFHISTGLR